MADPGELLFLDISPGNNSDSEIRNEYFRFGPKSNSCDFSLIICIIQVQLKNSFSFVLAN